MANSCSHSQPLSIAAGLAALRDSPYRGGRFDRWIKVKNRRHAAFSRVMDQFG
jgi:hypothetical protein